MELLSRAFTHLPSVLIALALLPLGLLVGALLRRTVLIAAVNAGLPSARLLASATQVATVGLAVAMALEHLRVGHQIIVVALTVIFGGIVFALALALGLGGQDLAREALTHLLRGPLARRRSRRRQATPVAADRAGRGSCYHAASDVPHGDRHAR